MPEGIALYPAVGLSAFGAQAAHAVVVGPLSGGAAVMTIRALDASDIPSTLGATTFPSLTLLYGNITNYNVYTDVSNNEYGMFGWVSNVLTIGTQKMGSGTARSMALQTDGVTALTISTAQNATFAGTVNAADYRDAAGTYQLMSYSGGATFNFGGQVAPSISSQLYIYPTALAGGKRALSVSPGAHTAVVSEVIDNYFLAHTMTITGSYATNRFSLFEAPTITAASALTVTNAATLAISGAPIAAGSAVITNSYSLWSQGGAFRVDGNSYTPQAGVLIYALIGTGSGANNPATATQNGWLQLEDATGKFWVPMWR